MLKNSGPYGWLTPSIAAITRSDAAFAAHALGMERDQMHLIGLILSHCDTGVWKAAEWQGFGEALRTRPRRQVMVAYAPELDAGCINLVQRLHGRLWRPATYRRLAALAREPNAGKWLAHAPCIKCRDLIVLSRLPPAYRTPAIVEVASQEDRLSDVRYKILVLRSAFPDVPDRLLARMIEKKGAGTKLWDFRRAAMSRRAFPAPPWEGDERLHPIRNYEVLREVARHFQNCVCSYLPQILEGQSVLYVYRDDGRDLAVVEIFREAVFGWEFNEALGPKNQELPIDLHFAIVRRLQAAGISGGPNRPVPAKGGIVA